MPLPRPPEAGRQLVRPRHVGQPGVARRWRARRNRRTACSPAGSGAGRPCRFAEAVVLATGRQDEAETRRDGGTACGLFAQLETIVQQRRRRCRVASPLFAYTERVRELMAHAGRRPLLGEAARPRCRLAPRVHVKMFWTTPASWLKASSTRNELSVISHFARGIRRRCALGLNAARRSEGSPPWRRETAECRADRIPSLQDRADLDEQLRRGARADRDAARVLAAQHHRVGGGVARSRPRPARPASDRCSR